MDCEYENMQIYKSGNYRSLVKNIFGVRWGKTQKKPEAKMKRYSYNNEIFQTSLIT